MPTKTWVLRNMQSSISHGIQILWVGRYKHANQLPLHGIPLGGCPPGLRSSRTTNRRLGYVPSVPRRSRQSLGRSMPCKEVLRIFPSNRIWLRKDKRSRSEKTSGERIRSGCKRGAPLLRCQRRRPTRSVHSSNRQSVATRAYRCP
jgi:hypothetical protein